MKQERFHSQLGDHSPVSWRHCEHCAQDRLFQNYKCLTCGIAKSRIHHSQPHTQYTFAQRMARLKLYKQRTADKSAYYKRLAEEARVKWEGKK